MRYETRLVACAATILSLTSCSSDGTDVPVSAGQLSAESNISDLLVKIGDPYTVGNVKYTPEDVALYDDVGFAGWYGNELAGSSTANGEAFLPNGVSAAHKTLPLPSYVEVTALDTGRTILVRINDRGPMTNDRLIDLSEGAARQLGVLDKGIAAVRVRRVNPPENERAALRAGQAATVRMDTPESLLKVLRDKLSKQPKPATAAVKTASAAAEKKTATKSPAPKPAEKAATPKSTDSAKTPVVSSDTKTFVVQLAAFASRTNADALAKKLGANVVASGDGKLFRVRFGPFATEKEAQAALTDAKKRGYPQARLLRE